MTKSSRVLSLCIAALLCLAVSGLNAADKQPSIEVTFDHPSQIYKCSEKAHMTFSVLNADKSPVKEGTLVVRLTNDNGDEYTTKSFSLAEANPVKWSYGRKDPGFLSARLSLRDAKGKQILSFEAAAGFDPEKIEPGQALPKDFNSFLEEGKKEVRAIPIDVQMSKIESLCNEKHDIFNVSFATVNKQRVYGFLSVPKQGKGPFPALINVPGAGPGRGPDTGYVDRGFIVLAMNVFPYPVPLDVKERLKVYNEYNKDVRYCYMGAQDRRTYFFRAAYLGIDRAIDWFAARKDVKKDKIGYEGVSQGGASALILTGMNKHIKYSVSSVPALCDHNGCLKGRASGWPKLVNFWKNDPKVIAESPYLDAVNFARKIECPIKVTVGFIDTTCSPSSVYAAYNVIPSKEKEMLTETKLGHRTGQQHKDAVNWLIGELQK